MAKRGEHRRKNEHDGQKSGSHLEKETFLFFKSYGNVQCVELNLFPFLKKFVIELSIINVCH